MTKQEVLEKLDEIFQDEFDDESIHVTEEDHGQRYRGLG